MITEKDLHEAIAECQGERNPNAQTCIKLAAYYTILENIREKPVYDYGVSGQSAIMPEVDYTSDTEFGKALAGRSPNDLWAVMDELMTTLQVVNPRLYNSVMRRINRE